MTLNLDKKDFQKKWNTALNIIGIDLQEALKDKLTKEHGVDLGNLKGSIRYRVDGNSVIISMDKTGEYVEFGTPPHFPPPKSLEGWAERKLGDKKLAYPLAVHISKNGTRPYPFIRNTLRQDSKGIIGEAFEEVFK